MQLPLLVWQDASNLFVVGDVIVFANHSQEYKVTAVIDSALTIEAINQPAGTGLTSAVDGSGSGAAASITRKWEWQSYFEKIFAGTPALVKVNGSSNDEIHIVVVDEDGEISGTKNTVLESYGFVSLELQTQKI